MIKTPICELFGIEYPIFQGGMAWVADASLASAVSNAGGLGIIAGMNSNGEQLRAEIRKCREMTDKPFGVNVMLMSPFVEEVARVVVEEKVPVLTTGAGNPGKYMPAWLEAGSKSSQWWLLWALQSWLRSAAQLRWSQKVAKAADTSVSSPPWRLSRRCATR